MNCGDHLVMKRSEETTSIVNAIAGTPALDAL